MSYASVAGAGPEQTAEEKCAPLPLEIENHEPVTRVLSVEVDTNSVHTIPAESISQTNQTESLENRVEDERKSVERHTRIEEESSEKTLKSRRKKATAQKKEEAGHANSGTDNHVSLFNTIAAVAVCSGLGFGAYRKYIAGDLNWKLVGVWTGIVGAFAITNFNLTKFFVSQFQTEE